MSFSIQGPSLSLLLEGDANSMEYFDGPEASSVYSWDSNDFSERYTQRMPHASFNGRQTFSMLPESRLRFVGSHVRAWFTNFEMPDPDVVAEGQRAFLERVPEVEQARWDEADFDAPLEFAEMDEPYAGR